MSWHRSGCINWNVDTPFGLRTKKAHTSSQPTRLERLANICPAFTQYYWGVAIECISATGGTEDKEKAAQNFNLWLGARNSDEMVVYTDGVTKIGQDRKNRADGNSLDQWLGTNGFSIGSNAEAYDAEMIGLRGGLEATLSSLMAGLHSIMGSYLHR